MWQWRNIAPYVCICAIKATTCKLMERFIKIGTWAKLAEITREGAYKRIKSGKLKTSEYGEHPLIDVEIYPPCKMRYEKTKLPERELPDWCYD